MRQHFPCASAQSGEQVIKRYCMPPTSAYPALRPVPVCYCLSTYNDGFICNEFDGMDAKMAMCAAADCGSWLAELLEEQLEQI